MPFVSQLKTSQRPVKPTNIHSDINRNKCCQATANLARPPHCRVLPPGEFNGKIPEPLPVYTFQFQVQFVLLLWLLSFACLHLKFVSVCSLHCTPSITWPVYDRLGVFSILKLSRNSEEEEVSWRHPFCGRFYRKDARKQTWLQTQLWSSNKQTSL